MIAQLIFGLLVACSLFAQTQVELKKQVKGELPPDKGGTGVSSCLENEGLVWQSGEFALLPEARGPTLISPEFLHTDLLPPARGCLQDHLGADIALFPLNVISGHG